MKFKEILCVRFRQQAEMLTLGLLDPIQTGRFLRHARECSCCSLPTEEVVEQDDCFSDAIVREYNLEALTLEEMRIVNRHINMCSHCFDAILTDAKHRAEEAIFQRRGLENF
jgi:hypothetical protein